MTRSERREHVERMVLSYVLADPLRFAWEMAGLAPGLFAFPLYRAIAEAICRVRDSGRRLHWRRVRLAMRKAGTLASAEGQALSPWGQRNGLAFVPRIMARSVASLEGMDSYMTELRKAGRAA